MSVVSSEITIDAEPRRVWEVLADFGNIQAFNPSVPRSTLTSETGAGVGTTRHCDLSIPGASIEERVIKWVDGEHYVVEGYASKGTPPLRYGRARLEVRPTGERTTASMSIDYRLKGGWLGDLFDRFLVRRQYETTVASVVAGLKHHVETGPAGREHGGHPASDGGLTPGQRLDWLDDRRPRWRLASPRP